ncbi:hypothetical protein GCM10010329_13890 [Streptomyces spiroverticillatus]|uniref:DUF6891 domain-containing protein n=1 Tax=Streptomyces finlayi TaxID=67296 RepID=A0A919CCU0_9ACTN|nr:hypothetical protein [Streptomyces finlayi]GGZ93957.1 hypothetical protein GCM10010329_13890 [Streptomyces spiroverticillatus]GHD06443.1 hypothetical protein GCM10010334_57930 [Streptomyces finlayi]
MSDILDITVTTESSAAPVAAHVTADALVSYVHRIGGDDDHFLVVRRIPADPDSYVQVWHEHGGVYEVEHRDGGPDRHFAATLTGPEAVASVVTGWARGAADGWDAGVEWERQDHTPPRAEPIPDLPPELAEAVGRYVTELVDCGYLDRVEVARAVQMTYGGEVSYPQTWRVVDRLWFARLTEQRGWRGRTDPERITEAFGALEGRGITAREHFACCRSCGLDEIGAQAAPGARGFVFFPTQCTAAAAAGGGLSLYYGGFAKSAAVTAAVGREVVAALAEAGLAAEWDGSPEQSILLPELEWRRRLVG